MTDWCPIADLLPELSASVARTLEQHVTGCPVCRERLALMAALHRTKREDAAPTTRCPDEEQLGAYMAKCLSPVAASEVRRHMLTCPRCLWIVTAGEDGTEEEQVAKVQEALALLPLKEVTVEVSPEPAGTPAEQRTWEQVAPLGVEWVKQQEGTRARLVLGTRKNGTYKVTYGQEWSEIIELPARTSLKAAASSKTKRGPVAGGFDAEADSHTLTVSFKKNILPHDGT